MREPNLATTTWTATGYSRSGKEGKRIYRLRVVGGLVASRGNDRPYFSIMADLDSRAATGGSYVEESVGRLHDEIETHLPGRFTDLIALHLSDDNGVPMHAEANGWYWLAGALGGLGESYHGGNSKIQHWHPNGSFDRFGEPTPNECLAIFARHFRISVADAQTVADAISTVIADGDRMSNPYSPEDARTVGRELWRATMEGMRDRWKIEAEACIARHGLVMYDGSDGVTSLILTHGTAADRELIEDALYCDLCNDHGHVADDHGEPLVIRDTGQRTVIDAVEVYVLDAMTLCQDAAQDASFQRLSALYDDWTDIDTDDERDEYAADYLTDIDEILSDAGFLPVTNPDQGAWVVYGPVTD